MKEVRPGSAGAEAGIENLHKIKMVGNMLVHSVKECIAILLPYVKASSDVTLTVWFGSKTMKIIVPGATRNGRGLGKHFPLPCAGEDT